jgi:hypothetical protein
VPKIITQKRLDVREEEIGVAFLGIDPGQKGGLTYILNGRAHYQPMPETELDIWQWFEHLPQNRFAVLERVHSMPQQSAQSGFTFGRGVGFLRGCLTASQTPFMDASPQEWMKSLGIFNKRKDMNKADGKNQLREKAQALFPTLDLWKDKTIGYKGRQLAVCDALLLAFYCRLKYGGGK